MGNYNLIYFLSLIVLLGSIPFCLGAKTRETQRGIPSHGVCVTPVTSSPVLQGEGPHWDECEGALYFVDIMGHSINRLIPATGRQTQAVIAGKSANLVIPVEGKSGTFLVGIDRSVSEVLWNGDNIEGVLQGKSLVSVDSDKPDNRFNDGKADPRGRLWAGTMGPEPVVGVVTPRQGSLFTFNTIDCIVKSDAHVSEIDISNGLAWSSDNSIMYYIDTGTDRVDAFDYDIVKGEISNRHPAFDFHIQNVTGHPDGMTIDKEGNLWVACFGGSQVIKVDPRRGNLLGTVTIPAERVTSVAFGGPNLDILYVTTSRFGLTPEELEKQPLAGYVFAVTGLGVQGYPGQRVTSLLNSNCDHGYKQH